MNIRRVLAMVTLGLLIGSGTISVMADDVVLIPGSTFKGAVGGRVKGVVQSESATEVVVKLGVTENKVPTDQIVRIEYDGRPASFSQAETKEGGGLLAEAADLYKKAAAEASAKPYLQQAAKFKEAEVTADIALNDPSKAAEASRLLDAFQKAYPDSRHAGPLLESQARLQLQKGDLAAVDKTIEAIAKLPNGEDRSMVLRAKILAKQGDHAKALEQLDKLIQAAPEGSVRRRELTLSHAENLAAMKKFTEAEAELRGVIKSSPAEDSAAQSVAYNTLGDCLLAAEKPKEALLAFLHTDLLYAKDREQHPRALAQIAQLWRVLKNDDRADEVIQRLKRDYPKSQWVAVATGGAK